MTLASQPSANHSPTILRKDQFMVGFQHWPNVGIGLEIQWWLPNQLPSICQPFQVIGWFANIANIGPMFANCHRRWQPLAILAQCWIAIWARSAAGYHCWPNVGKPINHLKWLGNGWQANVVLPTWCQSLVNVGNATINWLFLRIVGGWLAKGWLANVILPT